MAPDLALLPLLWARRRGTNAPPLLIAPRGELMPGALAQRPLAKRLYLALLRGLGLLARAQWHATQVEEAAAIERAVGARAHIAPDLPPPLADFPAPALTAHAPGPLRVLFLSRIDPVKNLGFAIDVLARVSRPVEFSIAGPIGNAAVWADCQARLQALPAHIQVRTLGPQSPDAVPPLLATQDLLFLPSLSENHGYVVQEALRGQQGRHGVSGGGARGQGPRLSAHTDLHLGHGVGCVAQGRGVGRRRAGRWGPVEAHGRSGAAH
jgi:glycosyltransferase involved in cell wall biosynthesis